MWSIKYVDCRSMLYSLHLRPLHHDIGNTGKKGKMAAICCYKGKDFDLWMFLGWSLNQQIQSRSEKNYFPKYIWIENLLMTCQQQGPGHLTRRTTRCLAGRRRPWTRRTPTPCSSSSSSCSGSASFSFVLPPWPSAIGTDHAPRVYTSTCLCCTVHVSHVPLLKFQLNVVAMLFTGAPASLHFAPPPAANRNVSIVLLESILVGRHSVTMSSVCSVSHCYCYCTVYTLNLGRVLQFYMHRDHHLWLSLKIYNNMMNFNYGNPLSIYWAIFIYVKKIILPISPKYLMKTFFFFFLLLFSWRRGLYN